MRIEHENAAYEEGFQGVERKILLQYRLQLYIIANRKTQLPPADEIFFII
jgi:hypothetical protein